MNGLSDSTRSYTLTNTIVLGGARIVGRERSISQKSGVSPRLEANGVDIQISFATAAKRVLHGGLDRTRGPSIVEPVGVDGPGDAGKGER